MERGVNVTVIYEVVVKVVAGFFRNKHRIVANVLYVPLMRAPPLPPLRADAYRMGMYLCNPLQDEAGWSALALIKVRVAAISDNVEDTAAAASDQGSINVACTVYIAKPSVYTRGTVIPCYMVSKIEPKIDLDSPSTLSGIPESPSDRDLALLEAFSAQKCVSVSLHRRLVYYRDARQTASATAANGGKISSEETSDHTKEVASAVWWSPKSPEQSSGVDCIPELETETEVQVQTLPSATDHSTASLLEGEIHLETDLLPSCEIPFLLVSYAVSVMLSPGQDLLVERIRPPPVDPPAAPSKRSSKRFSRSSSGSGKATKRSSRSSSLTNINSSGNRNSTGLNLNTPEDIASIPVRVVTVKGDGPLPVSFTPRISPKRQDLSIVQDLAYVGHVVVGTG